MPSHAGDFSLNEFLSQALPTGWQALRPDGTFGRLAIKIATIGVAIPASSGVSLLTDEGTEGIKKRVAIVRSRICRGFRELRRYAARLRGGQDHQDIAVRHAGRQTLGITEAGHSWLGARPTAATMGGG